jgi:hypothetical protein
MSRSARAQLVEICHTLPDVVSGGEQHIGFEVRKKRFAWFLDDHHGDGRVAVVCKAAPGRNTALVDEDPDRFFIPSYVGARGWVGIRLDVDDVDWDRVEELVLDSYRMTAPKRLVLQHFGT